MMLSVAIARGAHIFPKIWVPPQNSTCQEGDVVLYCEPTAIRYHHDDELVPRLCASLT